MRISEVRSAVVSVPLSKPVGWATNTIAVREYILAWVIAEDGTVGLGYGLGGRYPGGAAIMHDIIQTQFREAVLGSNSLMTEGIWHDLYHRSYLIGRRGAALRAMSVVDIALWDLNAKLAGLPLYKYLGGYRDEVKAYASGGYYSKDDPLRDLEDEIKAYLARGFSDVKIKVGGLPLARMLKG